MISALLYLQYHSLKNRTWKRLKRLKEPKYLAGGIVVGLYFYFYFIRYLFHGSGGRSGFSLGGTPETQLLFESLAAAILLVLVLGAWLLPHERAALAFTEAEVAFLFPAPISRRGLIHFKLLRSQTAILFTTLLLVLVTNRFGGNALVHAVGWWLILSTLSLHTLGCSFARTRLLDRGITNWQRRLAILLLLGIALIVLLLWVRWSMPELRLQELDSPEAIKNYAKKVLTSGPIPYLLFPFRLVVRPFLATTPGAFLLALLPALLLLALHYIWVVRSNVAFEEASLDASRKLAEKIAAVRAGNWGAANRKGKAKRSPFKLADTGPAPVALLWKNLISAGQAFTLRFWIVLVAIGVSIAVGVGNTPAGEGAGFVLGTVSAGLTVWLLILGPQLLRQDFRQDLPLADMLKSYPLPGWQIALGELLAPAAILTAVQWLLLLVAALFLWHAPLGALGYAGALGIGLGAALLVPVMNLITLQIPNAAVLLFPAWFQAGKEGAQGIEATGQRIIFVIGQMLVFLLVLIPPAITFSILFFLLKWLVGLGLAIPVAAAGAALVLASEAAVGLVLLGRIFDRFDVSAEPP